MKMIRAEGAVGWINARATRFAPLAPEIRSTPVQMSPTLVRICGHGISFSVHTCPDLSTLGLTSHKTAKTRCKRDALPLS